MDQQKRSNEKNKLLIQKFRLCIWVEKCKDETNRFVHSSLFSIPKYICLSKYASVQIILSLNDHITMYNNVIISLLLFANRLKFVFTFTPSVLHVFSWYPFNPISIRFHFKFTVCSCVYLFSDFSFRFKQSAYQRLHN